jgi:hypothetical protein
MNKYISTDIIEKLADEANKKGIMYFVSDTLRPNGEIRADLFLPSQKLMSDEKVRIFADYLKWGIEHLIMDRGRP